jgi:transcriptional regulator with XRE-family HTH domain
LELGDRNIVGKLVTELRMEKGMKQIELLAKLQVKGVDISVPSLSLLEGQKRLVTDIELKALADIFGVSADYLLGRTDERLG